MKVDKELGYKFDHDIRENTLFLIDDDGTKHNDISLDDAIKLAESKKKNIVLIVPSNENKSAIARVVDKGKFLFEAKKKEKEKNRQVQSTKVKEITVRPQIGDNDLLRFANNSIEWFKQGLQVKFRVKTVGKMRDRADLVDNVYAKYLSFVGDKGKVQQPLKKLSPIFYSAFLVPNNKK
jgi:translation initiation factor IF-3